MSIFEWLAKGLLPSEANEKLRWLINNLKEIYPNLYDDVINNSQEFTRSELLAWLDFMGNLVPPEGTDINALMEELEELYYCQLPYS